LNLGEVEQAKEAWVAANRNAPNISSLLELAKQLLQEDQPQRALEVMGLLKNMEQIDSRIAFVMQSICDALGDTEKAGQWRRIYETLREEETAENIMEQSIRDMPYNMWSVVFRAYFSAKLQRWSEADEMLDSVAADFVDEEAFSVLRAAVDQRKMGPEVLQTFRAKVIRVSQ
jgi:predicted Zn-dependent protease